jgi:hypothetical protein
MGQHQPHQVSGRLVEHLLHHLLVAVLTHLGDSVLTSFSSPSVDWTTWLPLHLLPATRHLPHRQPLALIPLVGAGDALCWNVNAGGGVVTAAKLSR